MFRLNHPQKTPLFDYYAPTGPQYCGLLSIPHSGENIPEPFTSFLSGNIQDYSSDVDFKVDELVDIPALQEAGVAVLVSNVHRICVDLNRAESNCLLFWKENTKGKKLVLREPSNEEALRLIDSYYRPYYEILKATLQDLEKRKTKQVSMVDLHSMPSRPTEYHMKQNPNQKQIRPDFCLSDRNGKTCTQDFILYFQNEFTKAGHDASINDPYIGGYVTEYVDQFRTNNIQIEINRSLYMDESMKCLLQEKAGSLKSKLTHVLISGFSQFDS